MASARPMTLPAQLRRNDWQVNAHGDARASVGAHAQRVGRCGGHHDPHGAHRDLLANGRFVEGITLAKWPAPRPAATLPMTNASSGTVNPQLHKRRNHSESA